MHEWTNKPTNTFSDNIFCWPKCEPCFGFSIQPPTGTGIRMSLCLCLYGKSNMRGTYLSVKIMVWKHHCGWPFICYVANKGRIRTKMQIETRRSRNLVLVIVSQTAVMEICTGWIGRAIMNWEAIYEKKNYEEVLRYTYLKNLQSKLKRWYEL
jgi:hypothetical protein